MVDDVLDVPDEESQTVALSVQQSLYVRQKESHWQAAPGSNMQLRPWQLVDTVLDVVPDVPSDVVPVVVDVPDEDSVQLLNVPGTVSTGFSSSVPKPQPVGYGSENTVQSVARTVNEFACQCILAQASGEPT